MREGRRESLKSSGGARAGRDDEARTEIVTALPDWPPGWQPRPPGSRRPRSPAHLAPVGLLADRDTAHLFTDRHQDRLRLLTPPRATTT
ncbi:hypothetical protein [Lapillicoccus sp.]|uniref:hypothetical protein n=1 Tax=Lapillicoccus sp. TaxID=1909287 RepID=UPI0025D36DF4|nr:hypothetical protein [Lapillicoccus sp.]